MNHNYSTVYLIVAASMSFLLSLSIWFFGNTPDANEQAIFVGLWVPSILSLNNVLK
jgi:hypothetical protein